MVDTTSQKQLFDPAQPSVDTHLGRRIDAFLSGSRRIVAPPFPRQLQIETTNICNHSCSFCAITSMERVKSIISIERFRSIAAECFQAGSREIGLFAGAEPLTHPNFAELVRTAKQIGYEYIYISTNGSLAKPGLLELAIDHGLNSIKFSVNGATRKHYQEVHGHDSFDKVIATIKTISGYKKRKGLDVFVGVSTVGYNAEEEFAPLRQVLAGHVDEFVFYQATNQSGQIGDLPLPPYKECQYPFNKVHVSVEGKLKVCCNDYENLLVTDSDDDLSLPIKERWNSYAMQLIRRMHLEGKLDHSLCDNCLNGSNAKSMKPLPLLSLGKH